ncbi:MAG: phage tail sheath family protein, partial [Chloroflexales bacterium]|nr:phage tail sheath family protein [Chloroflexales bacterium]
DAPPDEGLEGTLARRDALRSRAGALYFPWIVAGGRALPPSGHIAGLYARTDEEAAFFAAPANRELVGATDLALRVASIERGQLYAAQVNDLRALPGRGIYVMGASSLAGANQGAWSSIAVCRLFITVGRWLARAMIDLPFSPNDVQLWVRVRRELSAYFWDLWRRGALRGATPEEAFYVKCDRETNGDDVRAAGLLVTEIGLAPAVPAEFIVARLVQRPGAVTALAE